MSAAETSELLVVLKELVQFITDTGYCTPGIASRMEAAQDIIDRADRELL